MGQMFLTAASQSMVSAGTSWATEAGGPVVGQIFGQFLQQKFFPAENSNPGARLASTQVQISSYGKAIALVYGNARLAGNIIWARDLVEIDRNQNAGGKGGGKKEQVGDYAYFATFAVAICEGPCARIDRIWADNTILEGDFFNLESINHEIFLGTETQNASAIIESYDGTDETPAYRGTVYAVFEKFPLEKFGNRIPNLTFEVIGGGYTTSSVNKITAVNFIPGSGEDVYNTTIQYKYRTIQDTLGGTHPGPFNTQNATNMHNYYWKANVLLSLDNMKKELPNVQDVLLVVNWFANSKNPATLQVKPYVEFVDANTTMTEDWTCSTYNRSTAVLMKSSNGALLYGGTPSDKSILNCLKELKNRGYNVTLYPMLLIATDGTEGGGETAKPWRGRITPASAANITRFFGASTGCGYFEFINHYATGQVAGEYFAAYFDGILLGSEFVGLTTAKFSGTYPAAAAIAGMAQAIKTGLAGIGYPTKEVAYSADWSEYHSVNGEYHLDALWTSSYIDYIGIDNYIPVTPDLDQKDITYDKIFEYWDKGEGKDYYYSDPARTVKVFYSTQQFAWKNILYWWTNAHPGTAWTGKNKPIRFIEYGFPSVDGAANQPNVFYDPTSVESFLPRKSTGKQDISAQRVAISATIDYFTSIRAQSGNANFAQKMYLWAWDARPYPFWPALADVWADGGLYKFGHWVQGKTTYVTLADVITDILKRSGIAENQINLSEIQGDVRGFLMIDQTTARAMLEQLQIAYQFILIESGGVIYGKMRKRDVIFTVPYEMLAYENGETNGKRPLSITRESASELPSVVNITYFDNVLDYQTGAQSAARFATKARGVMNISLSLTLTTEEAKTAAEIELYRSHVESTRFKFALPPKYSLIEPGDVIILDDGATPRRVRVLEINAARAGVVACEGVLDVPTIFDLKPEYVEPVYTVVKGFKPPKLALSFLELGCFPSDTSEKATVRFAVAAESAGWSGAVLQNSSDGLNFSKYADVPNESVIGVCLNHLTNVEPNYPDLVNKLRVVVQKFGGISTITEQELYNGANAALVGSEIIQFRVAELGTDDVYTLSHLLRGRLGTENKTSGHVPGEKFVLLNSAIIKKEISPSDIGQAFYYKLINVSDETETPAALGPFTIAGSSLECLPVAGLRATRNTAGDVTFRFNRRARYGGTWRDKTDVSICETSIKFEIEILKSFSLVARTIETTTEMAVYTAAQQITDFGATQSAINVRVYQISTNVGRGIEFNGLV